MKIQVLNDDIDDFNEKIKQLQDIISDFFKKTADEYPFEAEEKTNKDVKSFILTFNILKRAAKEKEDKLESLLKRKRNFRQFDPPYV